MDPFGFASGGRSVLGEGQPRHHARRRGHAEAAWLRKQLCLGESWISLDRGENEVEWSLNDVVEDSG